MLAITSYEDDARGDDEHGRDAYAIPIARISAACQAALVTLSVPSAPGAEPESETITTDVQLELPSNLTEASIKDLAESVKALHLSNEQKQALDTLKGDILNDQEESFLARVEAVIAAQRATSGGDGTPSDRVMLLQVLGVWWNLAQGLDSVNALRVADALQYLRRAVYGFALLGDQDQLFEAAVCGLAAEAALQTLRPSNSGLAQLHAQIPSLRVTMIIALGAGLGPVTPDYCAPRPH